MGGGARNSSPSIASGSGVSLVLAAAVGEVAAAVVEVAFLAGANEEESVEVVLFSSPSSVLGSGLKKTKLFAVK